MLNCTPPEDRRGAYVRRRGPGDAPAYLEMDYTGDGLSVFNPVTLDRGAVLFAPMYGDPTAPAGVAAAGGNGKLPTLSETSAFPLGFCVMPGNEADHAGRKNGNQGRQGRKRLSGCAEEARTPDVWFFAQDRSSRAFRWYAAALIARF